jgi:PncC family amidohydrolase
MKSIILSIGDELVLGQTVDTNSAWLSKQLAAVGCDIAGHATVPDDQKLIEEAIRTAAGQCDVLLISGGIGPTEDDLTRQAMAAVMGVELEMNQVWLAKLTDLFKSRNREMPEINKIQAMIPRGAEMIDNTAGTAAGIRATLGIPSLHPLNKSLASGKALTPQSGIKFDQLVSEEYMERMFGKDYKSYKPLREFTEQDLLERRRILEFAELYRKWGSGTPMEVFVMPGVPKEMKTMFTRDVLPYIREKSGGAVILSRTLHTFGMGESAVAEKLGLLMKRDRSPSVGTTVANNIVSLRINARYPTLAQAQAQMESTTAECEKALGDLIFGRDEKSLPEVIADLLTVGEKKLVVSVAEGVTGGLLAKMLTDLPGSGDYFSQGWVTFSNLSMYERLGVPTDVINVYSPTSEPVAEAMARSARRLSKSTYALAVTGVAGPEGGRPTIPVGTICIALAKPDPADRAGTLVDKRTFQLMGDREMIRDRACKMALTMLRFELMGKAMPF